MWSNKCPPAQPSCELFNFRVFRVLRGSICSSWRHVSLYQSFAAAIDPSTGGFSFRCPISLTPQLQRGVNHPEGALNRFNGFAGQESSKHEAA